MTIKDKLSQKKTSYAVTNIKINENYLSINFAGDSHKIEHRKLNIRLWQIRKFYIKSTT